MYGTSFTRITKNLIVAKYKGKVFDRYCRSFDSTASGLPIEIPKNVITYCKPYLLKVSLFNFCVSGEPPSDPEFLCTFFKLFMKSFNLGSFLRSPEFLKA